jgi:antitoxin (DNA-binding transcriptional repressor) of toxin-antitoxin stability system
VKTVNVQYAKTQLSRLLEEAAAGETIVIGKAGKPMAMLVAWRPELKKRQLGGWRGQVWIADDFDAPSSEIEKLFLGEKPARRRSRKPGAK